MSNVIFHNKDEIPFVILGTGISGFRNEKLIKEGKANERDKNWKLFCERMGDAEIAFIKELSNTITKASKNKIA